ncbi:MAG: hypothetical protein AAB453_02495 [Patescibacteria group bacterium]
MKFIKDNLIVLVAFLLPILLIIGTALTLYLPGAFLTTQYDFVYTVCDNNQSYNYSCNNFLKRMYEVKAGKLVANQIDQAEDLNRNNIPDNKEISKVRLFYHDTKEDESREITLSEAQGFTYSDLLTSPDGVSVSSGYERNNGFLFFDGGSATGYYLTKGSKQRRLSLINENDRYNYGNEFQFIGWVIIK